MKSPLDDAKQIDESLRHRLQGKQGPLANDLTQAMRSVSHAMESHENAEQLQGNLATLYWERVVGPQAAGATEAESVNGGVLFVNTKSSVWSHELTLYKPRILAELNRFLGKSRITDIRFRVRKLKKESVPIVPETPLLEELKSVILEPAERGQLRAQLEELIYIKDDVIREKIAHRLALDAKLRHWRIERGWKVCTRCQAAQNTEYSLCPVCRLTGG